MHRASAQDRGRGRAQTQMHTPCAFVCITTLLRNITELPSACEFPPPPVQPPLLHQPRRAPHPPPLTAPLVKPPTRPRGCAPHYTTAMLGSPHAATPRAPLSPPVHPGGAVRWKPNGGRTLCVVAVPSARWLHHPSDRTRHIARASTRVPPLIKHYLSPSMMVLLNPMQTRTNEPVEVQA